MLRAPAIVATILTIAMPALAQEPPVTLSVWARVLFGEDGKLRETTLLDEDRYPKKFSEAVKERIGRASIKAPVVDGKPTTMRTAMELRFTTEGAVTKISGISMSPLPLKREFELKQPDAADTWTGEISATCTVSPEGLCGPVEVAGGPNLPETLRRYMKTAMERMRFEPQEVGGKPIEGEYVHRVVVTSATTAGKDFRDQRRVH